MTPYRIALAQLPFPASGEDSVRRVLGAIEEAAGRGARIVCFPENYVPGYRGMGKSVAAPDEGFLEAAFGRVAEAAGQCGVSVVLGAERIVDGAVRATAAVFGADGALLGFQDKVQVDPSAEGLFAAGSGRQVFEAGGLKFGVVICHEGWRYPETVRWAARRGAQVVFHPHISEAEEGSHRPRVFAERENTFHEKAALCRAAENTIYFATVNYASEGAPTATAVAGPEGTVVDWMGYGEEGLLVVDLELEAATGLLAKRWKGSE